MVWTEEKGNMEDIWTPEAINSELVGRVTKIDSTSFGRQFSVEAKNGVFKTPCHKALQNLMTKIVEGDLVKIVYTGEKPSGKGNPTQMYKVFVDNPGVISEMMGNIRDAKLL